jgi:hypothetical protein
MNFDYEPLSEEQCEKAKQFELLQPGVYDFEVFGAECGPSKAGNPQITLKIKVWDKNGKIHTVLDWLGAKPNMIWKTLHFCKAVGLEKEYLNKTFNEDLCLDKSGKLVIIIQPLSTDKDGRVYPEANRVKDYIYDGSQSNSKVESSSSKDSFIDDSLPF